MELQNEIRVRIRPDLNDLIAVVHPSDSFGHHCFIICTRQYRTNNGSTVGPVVYGVLSVFLDSSHFIEALFYSKWKIEADNVDLQPAIARAFATIQRSSPCKPCALAAADRDRLKHMMNTQAQVLLVGWQKLLDKSASDYTYSMD